MLTHLVSKGVFEETAPGRFMLNEAGRHLQGAARFLDLDGIVGRMGRAWGTACMSTAVGVAARNANSSTLLLRLADGAL